MTVSRCLTETTYGWKWILAHGSEDSVHCGVVGMVHGWFVSSGAQGTNQEGESLAEVELA